MWANFVRRVVLALEQQRVDFEPFFSVDWAATSDLLSSVLLGMSMHVSVIEYVL